MRLYGVYRLIGIADSTLVRSWWFLSLSFTSEQQPPRFETQTDANSPAVFRVRVFLAFDFSHLTFSSGKRKRG
mgnify:CR=1 FL=1